MARERTRQAKAASDRQIFERSNQRLLERLEAENAQLRGRVAELMLEIQALRDALGHPQSEFAIGHVRVDLIARYNKDEAWDGRRDAFTRVSDHVASLIGPRAGAAVIPLRD